ncbi:MAG: L-glyceraldehyde 3-phosphate reductase [Clostridiales bacterium]|nr:L-glyceraldehyde 3-phosphate reductase [Clostridiales bacterium]
MSYQQYNPYTPAPDRYNKMIYRRSGRSGLKLPIISLGLWHNFGDITTFGVQQKILRAAFDNGITHFDLANNYGPPAGEAERNFGEHLKRDWRPYRDELVISTKAGFGMWRGPYGDHGSRKYLIASLDQSLRRMNLEYVDIFYHHRPDDETPIEETMGALYDIVKSGKALYAGISNYNPEQTKRAIRCMKEMGMHMLIHQPNYNMFNRSIENGLTDVVAEEGVGIMAFAPLAGGRLTGRYLNGIPEDSRASHDPRFLRASDISEELLKTVRALNAVAERRGQTLAQLALVWTLRDPVVTSALIGASKPEQVVENVKALENMTLTEEELNEIDTILANR